MEILWYFALLDVIEEILHQHSKKPLHAEIIANYYSYDNDVSINDVFFYVEEALDYRNQFFSDLDDH